MQSFLMRSLKALGPVLACALQPVGAQTFTGIPTVDSAGVARIAWSTAVRASRAGDVRGARDAVERAATAWPTQATYAWSRATLAAALGDSMAVEQALRAYAGLGLGRALSDTIFDRYRALPWFADVEIEHRKHRAPVQRSRVFATLADSTLLPEGVDVHRRTGNIYVMSVRHGTITERRPDGHERVVWPREGNESVGSALAVRVDPRGDRLWATVSATPLWERNTPSDSSGAILEIRISDGEVLRQWALPPGPHALGDVAIGPQGDVYVSNSVQPVLYRLRRSADTLESFRDPLFRSLQGIAPATGDEVYVADYSHGILHVDLKTRVVTRVADAPSSTSLGVDGLIMTDRALIGIQNGVTPARVMRFELDETGKRFNGAYVLDRRPDASEPTIGVLIGEELVYVANGEGGKFGPDGKLRPGLRLERPMLLAVPVARPR